jgi:hypothetical protein
MDCCGWNRFYLNGLTKVQKLKMNAGQPPFLIVQLKNNTSDDMQKLLTLYNESYETVTLDAQSTASAEWLRLIQKALGNGATMPCACIRGQPIGDYQRLKAYILQGNRMDVF